jgi:hypothetical protein
MSVVFKGSTFRGGKFGKHWNPNQLTGLELWLDASDSSTVLNSISPDTSATDGQAIRRWLDKSGNDRHANQTTGANQPLLDADGLNSKGVLTFDGINDFFTSGTTSTWNFLHNGTESLVVLVAKAGSSANPDAIMAYLSTTLSSSDTGFALRYVDRVSSSENNGLNAQVTRSIPGQFAINTTENDNVLPNQFNLIESIFDADNATASVRFKARVNGGLEFGSNAANQSPVTSNSSNVLHIGSGVTVSLGALQYIDGAIAEIIICSNPNTTNRENLRNYLASKWGITLA